jgi:hypothetical protein
MLGFRVTRIRTIGTGKISYRFETDLVPERESFLSRGKCAKPRRAEMDIDLVGPDVDALDQG